MGSMLVGALVSTPLWVAVSQKVNDNKKMSVVAGLLMVASFVPMIFAVTRWQWMATLALFGVSLGGQWFMDPPTMGDVLDDAAVRTGKREQSIYYGYQTFITRFGEALKAGVIALAHILTGFVEGRADAGRPAGREPRGVEARDLRHPGPHRHRPRAPGAGDDDRLLAPVRPDARRRRQRTGRSSRRWGSRTMDAARKRVAVIGSGMAGLTAGAYLARDGHRVTVYEQYPEPGGVTATITKDGFSWDLGPLLLEGFGPGDIGTKILTEMGVPAERGRDRSPPSRATGASSFPTSRCGGRPNTRARCGEGTS